MKRLHPALKWTLAVVALMPLVASLTRAQPRPNPEPCNGAKGEVAGFITGPDGSPIRDAIIRYYGVHWKPDCRSGVWEFTEARSDSGGGYHINVPLGKGRMLSVERTDTPGFPPEFIRLPEIVLGANRADHEFKIYRIRGTMVDASGGPVERATIVYYRKPIGQLQDDSGLPRASVRAGRFELIVHEPGTYKLWLRTGLESVGVVGDPDTVVVSSDTTIAVTARGYGVGGRVVDEDGAVLTNAIVVARDSKRHMMEDQTDASGHYSLVLPAGNYRLAVIYPWGKVQACEPESISVSRSSRIDLKVTTSLKAPSQR